MPESTKRTDLRRVPLPREEEEDRAMQAGLNWMRRERQAGKDTALYCYYSGGRLVCRKLYEVEKAA